MLVHEDKIELPLTITIHTRCAKCKAEITPKHVEGNIYEITPCTHKLRDRK